ncbi:MAG: hypothetical protein R3B09_15565 [Nannocystaceae bacterium]
MLGPTASVSTESHPTESKPTESKPTGSISTGSNATASSPTASISIGSNPIASNATGSNPTASNATAISTGSTPTASAPAIGDARTLEAPAAADATSMSPARLAALTAGLPRVAREAYAVGQEVAQGGIGRVLRARDQRLDRPVAIKELLVWDERHEQRFVREALLTARLQHPAIVPIYEAGRWPDGEPFYAMKLVSGRSLAELIAGALFAERLALLPHAGGGAGGRLRPQQADHPPRPAGQRVGRRVRRDGGDRLGPGCSARPSRRARRVDPPAGARPQAPAGT